MWNKWEIPAVVPFKRLDAAKTALGTESRGGGFGTRDLSRRGRVPGRAPGLFHVW
jgi:hypothetical protein